MLDPYIRRAQIERVTDGDTVRMIVDLGYRNYTETAIRLLGVDAPEIFRGSEEEKAKGQAAKAWVKDWFEKHFDGKTQWPFLIRSHKDKKSLDRWIGEVFDLEGNCLNVDIVAAGHAVKSD